MAQQSDYIEPADFPVQWQDPQERELTWVWDDVHTAIPSTPMTIAVNALWSQALARPAPDAPPPTTPRPARRVINGFAYSVRAPARPIPQDGPQRQEMLDNLRSARQRWDNELVPTLTRNIQAMQDTDLRNASRQQLLHHLDAFLAHYQEQWRVHMQAVGPVFTSTGFLVPLFQRITGSTDESEPYRLLQGFDNKSLEVDCALRQIARRARDDAEVAAIFDDASSSLDLLQHLQATSAGEAFMTHLQAFLDTYGHRSSALDLSYPTWLEQPDFVLLTIKGLLTRDLDAEDQRQVSLAKERDDLVQQTLDRTDDSTRDEFLEILGICQAIWPIREDHAFYIEQASGSQMHHMLMECGRSLAQEGVLDLPEDVFYLNVDELKDALANPDQARLKAIAEPRKVEREHFMRITPPQFLGRPPSDELLNDTSESAKFVRVSAVSLEERPSILRGGAGSAGRVTGVARLVDSPDDFWKVQPGDILVCRSTSPPWTPLFAVIDGLVTDAGGVLSHGAIVAREYKLPAVMGTKHATRAIRDGQLLTLDGTAGLVHLH